VNWLLNTSKSACWPLYLSKELASSNPTSKPHISTVSYCDSSLALLFRTFYEYLLFFFREKRTEFATWLLTKVRMTHGVDVVLVCGFYFKGNWNESDLQSTQRTDSNSFFHFMLLLIDSLFVCLFVLCLHTSKYKRQNKSQSPPFN
jgi:hypothetical protein